MSISDNEFELVSQSAHGFSGWAVMLTIGKLLPHFLWWGAGLYVAYAAVKEFYFDQHFETPEVRGSSLMDFCFQILGGAIGVFVATR